MRLHLSQLFLYAAKVDQLTHELNASKENVTKPYSRWEELEAIRSASMDAKAG
jgi:hypothetical protein